jgi:hypothetical protein
MTSRDRAKSAVEISAQVGHKADLAEIFGVSGKTAPAQATDRRNDVLAQKASLKRNPKT